MYLFIIIIFTYIHIFTYIPTAIFLFLLYPMNISLSIGKMESIRLGNYK